LGSTNASDQRQNGVLKATIEGIRGVYKGRKVDLPKARLDIGRDINNSMVFQTDASLSRKHASIFFQDGTWFCMDLGSTNGTYLNGTSVGAKPIQIPDQSIISCGQQEFRISYEKTLIDTVRSVFTLSISPPVVTPPIPKQPTPPIPSKVSATEEWYGIGKTLSIHGLTIANPMAYVGSTIHEPSLIAPKLRVSPSPSVEELPYWPSYRQMSPGQRWNYLKWLEGGRRGSADTGFLFVFFYGLERRLTGPKSDQLPLDERKLILSEIRALCDHYPDNYSFHHYCSRLEQSQWSSIPELVRFSSFSEGLRLFDDEVFVFAISCLSHHKRPFTTDHAMEWFDTECVSVSKVAASRCRQEAKLLFKRRIPKLIGDGIILGPGKSNLPISYMPANMSLRIGKATRSIPRALEAQKIVNQLRALALTCFEDLTPTAKMIGTEPTVISRNRASFLLPSEIRHLSQPALALSKSLARLVNVKPYPTLSSVQEEIGIGADPLKKLEIPIFEVCSELGFIVEPDPRFGVVSGSQIETVAIAKCLGNPSKEVSKKASGALRASLLVASVLRTTEGDSPLPSDIIVSTVADAFDLKPGEGQRVEVFVAWLAENNPKVTKPAILAMDEEFRENAKRVLLSVVRRSARVTAPVIKALATVLTAWGWTENEVYSQLHEEEPVLIVREKDGKRYGIPKQPSANLDSAPIINRQKLREQQEHTKTASQLLGDVFSEPEIPVPVVASEPSESQEQVMRTIISALVPGELSKADWLSLASSHGIASGALLERLNDYAIEKCGDPLIVGGAPFEVEEDILIELQHE